MTDEELVENFKEYYLPAVVDMYGKDDTQAIDQAWFSFIDNAYTDDSATEHQYNNLDWEDHIEL